VFSQPSRDGDGTEQSPAHCPDNPTSCQESQTNAPDAAPQATPSMTPNDKKASTAAVIDNLVGLTAKSSDGTDLSKA
jgi:hypothetical protein